MSAPPARGLTVVVPAHDEAESIGATVRAIATAFAADATPVEILVVDDGSTDATAASAEAAGARVLRHPTRAGYGRALKTGIVAARHELIAITDGDGTYPIEVLPELVPLMAEYDLVVGARTGVHYRARRLRSPFLWLASFVAGQWIPDPNSGLRVFRRRDVLPLFADLPRGFSFTTTQTLIMTLSGAFIHYRAIEYRPRIGRSKIRVLRQTLQVGQGLAEVVLRHNPLKLFLLAAVVPLLGMLAVPWWGASRGAALLACVILACTSLLTLGLGMVAVVALRLRSTRPSVE